MEIIALLSVLLKADQFAQHQQIIGSLITPVIRKQPQTYIFNLYLSGKNSQALFNAEAQQLFMAAVIVPMVMA
jgi:hypothetical protein